MESKKELITEMFNHSFNLQKFIDFIQELFKGNVRYKNNLEFSPKVKGEFKGVVKEFLELGWYKDNNRKSMVIAVVRLERENLVARSRAMQRNFVKDYFLKNGNDSALVAFYNKDSSDWRLSFIKLDYSYKEAKFEEDITPAKRFSFLLGENEKHHTAISRFLPLLNSDIQAPSINEIEEAFNIEVVTKEFFDIYCDLYLEIKKCLDGQEKFIKIARELNFKSEEFSKKLMGQIVFLYFLQKKGWLGVQANPKEISNEEVNIFLENKNYDSIDVFGKAYQLKDGKYIRNDRVINTFNNEEAVTLNNIFINTKYDANWGSGDKNFIRNLFNRAVNEGKNFYSDYLEHLFYNALNDKRGANTYFKELNCKIPFLNGGLFQPITENYDYKNYNFIIPNKIFSNKEKTKQGDIGNGILDVFDRYAFTIKEDEPLEKEVAVDPEMLGKVFENLLDVADRKKKGAYYTPREIVHYMCQESLINYLITEVQIEYKDAETLIRYGDVLADLDSSKKAFQTGEFKMPLEVRKNAKKIDLALSNVKIADPAVGSGAFPLGILNEIVRARMNLTQYMSDDINTIYRDYTNMKGRNPYDLKLQTIQRCIHAVDIERSAVDIAKLRLWLSLIVEESDFKNVKPLPNLDYNIMVGNSLLEEFEGVKLFNEKLLEEKNNSLIKEASLEQMSFFNNKKESEYLLDEIYNLQEKFFNTSEKEEKIQLKDEIDKLEWTLIEKAIKENEKEELLPKIKEFKRTNTKPYFLWKLNFAKVFREKGGFDIVIGNPPYVGEKGNKEIFRPIADSEFGKRFYQGKMDLFYFFFHKGIDIAKKNGLIFFITTNYYITADSAIKLRKDFKERCNILKLINFDELKIFENALGQHNMITMLSKSYNNTCRCDCYISKKTGFADANTLRGILLKQDKETEYLTKNQDELFDTDKLYIRLNNSNVKDSLYNNIINKIRSNSWLLGDFCYINTGVNTGCDFVTRSNYEQAYGTFDKNIGIRLGDGIFVITQDELNSLDLNEEEKSIIYKFYKNSDIGQYVCPIKWEGKYLIYITKDTDINIYPNIKKHLCKYRKFLELKREYQEGKLPWYSLHWAREKEVFTSSNKIVLPYRSKQNTFALSNDEFFGSKDILYIRSRESNISIKYILALLNSKLYFYWLWNEGKRKGNILELYVTPISEIPIKMLNQNLQNNLVELIDIILINIQNIDETDYYISKIDSLIYEYYNLSEEEISFVESFFKNKRLDFK